MSRNPTSELRRLAGEQAGEALHMAFKLDQPINQEEAQEITARCLLSIAILQGAEHPEFISAFLDQADLA